MLKRFPRVLTRVAIYLVIIGAVIAWQYWQQPPAPEALVALQQSQDPPPPPSPSAAPMRLASSDEWVTPIADLGAQRLAKQQPWVGINGWDAAAGELVWWHDGTYPRIAYLPAPGEVPERAGPALFIAIQNRQAVLFGDPEFVANLGEWSPSYELPAQWTVLMPPGTSQP